MLITVMRGDVLVTQRLHPAISPSCFSQPQLLGKGDGMDWCSLVIQSIPYLKARHILSRTGILLFWFYGQLFYCFEILSGMKLFSILLSMQAKHWRCEWWNTCRFNHTGKWKFVNIVLATGIIIMSASPVKPACSSLSACLCEPSDRNPL